MNTDDINMPESSSVRHTYIPHYIFCDDPLTGFPHTISNVLKVKKFLVAQLTEWEKARTAPSQYRYS
jgi:hypothetical protein